MNFNMNPNAKEFYPKGLNPNAKEFYPKGLNPYAKPFIPKYEKTGTSDVYQPKVFTFDLTDPIVKYYFLNQINI